MRPTPPRGRGSRNSRAGTRETSQRNRPRRTDQLSKRKHQQRAKAPKKNRGLLTGVLSWLGFVPASAAEAPRQRRTKTARPPRKTKTKRPKRPRSRLLKLGSSQRRLGSSLLAVCLVLGVLGGRLVQLQTVNGSEYAKAAREDRVRTFTLPAARGQILDRNGNVLAYTLKSKTIFADPKEVKDPVATAQLLAPLLHKSFDEVYVNLRNPGRYVVLNRQVSLTDAQKITDLGLAGIGDQDEQQRLFPSGTTAANVLGFINRDGIGQAGIEQSLNKELAGKAGSRVVEVGNDSETIPAGIRRVADPIPGQDVQLTISADLQYVAQTALNTAVQESGAKDGQVVVLDAKTAEVLAMASAPTYDSADPGKSSPKLLNNPAVSSVFEPGSANKVVTFSAAVEAGLIKPETVFKVPGQIKVADRVVHDAWPHPDMNFTATGILAKSSNVGTLLIAQQLGQERFYDYLRKFGVGSATGIELPNESAGLLPPISQWSGSTFGNLPIGQGLSVTSLQLASMYQAIANDGVRVQPRIVRSVDNSPFLRAQEPSKTRVVSPETAKTVRDMLEAVTKKGGTAPSAAIDGYRIAGKTGTAQQPDSHCKCYRDTYWSTFAGMASSEDPNVVIAVMLNQPRRPVQNTPAGPYVFKQIATYALKQRGVVPSGSKSPTFRLVGE